MMLWILAKITSFSQKLFSEKNVFSLNFISAVWRLLVTAEIIAHYRNFSKIDAPGQKYAGTVIRTIERNHFRASLVHRNHFCCMMKIFCIENTDESRTCLYWAIILTDFS